MVWWRLSLDYAPHKAHSVCAPLSSRIVTTFCSGYRHKWRRF